MTTKKVTPKKAPAKKAPTKKPPPKKVGRPTIFTEDLADQICALLAMGKSMRKVCALDSMPDMATVFRWLRVNKEFCKQYEKAKQEAADYYADEMVDIADDEASSEVIIDGVPVLDPDTGKPYKVVTATGVQHARLRVDTRKWIAAKLKPKKYGDRVTNEIQPLDENGDRTKWQVQFINADLAPDNEVDE